MSGTMLTLNWPGDSRWVSASCWLRSSLRAFPVTLAVVVVCIAVYASSTWSLTWQLSEQVSSSPTTILTFTTLWTSLTCHLTHWSFDQLCWDVLAFAVLGYLCEQTGTLRYLCMLLISGFAVSFSVMWFHPELEAYRGLSGIDSALFAYMACYVAASGVRNRDRLWSIGGGMAWLLFVGKVTYELVSGQTLFVEAGGTFQPLPVSHVAGAIAGSLTWLVWIDRSQPVSSRSHV